MFLVLGISPGEWLTLVILASLSLLSLVFISSITSSITLSKSNYLSITSVITLPLFIPVLIFSMITSEFEIQKNSLYLFFIAYFLLNLAFSPLLTSFALRKLTQ